MEIAALVLSIISLLASSAIAIWQSVLSTKWNKINIQSTICEKIFDDFLISRIPQGRKFIKFDEHGKFTGGEKLNKVIVDMKKESLYFMYNDKAFYDSLEAKLTEIEDYITGLMGKQYDSINQPSIYNKLDKLINDVYDIIQQKKFKG